MTSHDVNDLLHTLRGEQFRHSQNQKKSRAHLLPTPTHNHPTLPTGLTGYDESIQPDRSQHAQTAPEFPVAPKSWTALPEDVRLTSTWRAQALSIVRAHFQPPLRDQQILIPRLTLLCLRIINISFTSADFTQDILSFIPIHLRRDLIRDTAVISPLPSSKLYALCEPDGHADGELIIVGPYATLRDNHFRQISPSVHQAQPSGDWDTDDPTPSSLHTLVLLSVHLSSSTFLTLPPTITHLALINLPQPISLHRLPSLCPLLIVLDLSYNHWLSREYKDTLKIIERVEWSRWNHLHTLGYRDCYITDGMPGKLNKGRWDDIIIVQ